MPIIFTRSIAPLLLILGVGVGVTARATSTAASTPWREYADPAEAGFSTVALDDARGIAEANRSGAVVAVYRGAVFAAWGDVARPFMAHSVRKGLAGALYGQAIAAGTLSLDATLADLHIDDAPALTPVEKSATVRDLLASRSGVFHDAAYAGDQDRNRPARGSHAPGTFWFYNNWDFNILETLYERATGADIYQAFDRLVARRIGMEDFTPDGLRVLEPSASRFPAHTFRISGRDLARFGQLYLQDGRWNGEQVVPSAWVRDSLTPHSDLGDGAGFGYLWWTYAAGSFSADTYPGLAGRDVVLLRGTGGQALFLIPSAEIVIAHRADTDNGREVPGPAIWKMVDRLVAARTGTSVAAPRLRPMSAVPLASQAPPPVEPKTIPLAPAVAARVAGDYAMPGGQTVRVFVSDGRLFVNVPGMGEGELFPTAGLTFIAPVVPGARAAFAAGPDGAIARMTLTVGRQVIEAIRR